MSGVVIYQELTVAVSRLTRLATASANRKTCSPAARSQVNHAAPPPAANAPPGSAIPHAPSPWQSVPSRERELQSNGVGARKQARRTLFRSPATPPPAHGNECPA